MSCTSRFTWMGLAVIAFLAACAASTEDAPSTGSGSDADTAAIRDLFEQFDSTATAGQAEEWMSLLSDDILWMVPNQPTLVGRDAVWERVGPFFADWKMHHLCTIDELRVAGDWAYVRGTYEFRVTPKAGGETTEELGKFVYVLECHADDSWKIAQAIWNLNHATS